MSTRIDRREWLERAILIAGGGALGAAWRLDWWPQRRSSPASPKSSPGRSFTANYAVSLRELQERARRARNSGTWPPELLDVCGLNRVAAVILDGHDVILAGAPDSAWPPIHLDDLTVSLRSAFETEPLYAAAAPGVTIDPRDGLSDPWSIQDVRVLGLPHCRMSKRQTALDYELKLVGSGISQLDGVADSFSATADNLPLCADDRDRDPGHDDVRSRFWFAPRYPDQQPRFEADGGTVHIRKPIDVHVLTERTAPAPPAAEIASVAQAIRGAGQTRREARAERFAASVTRLLATETRREYNELLNDFRIIEVGRLLRFLDTPPDRFHYLLSEHQLELADVPSLVVGIQRTDNMALVCGGEVEKTPRGIVSRSRLQRVERRYRGGVDAGVQVGAADVTSVPGELAELRDQVTRSRPEPNALAWNLRAGRHS